MAAAGRRRKYRPARVTPLRPTPIETDLGLYPRKTKAGTVVRVEEGDGEWACWIEEHDRTWRLLTSGRLACVRAAETHAMTHGGWAE